MNTAVRRVQNETKALCKCQEFPSAKGWEFEMISDSLYDWEVSMPGPINSPYYGFVFKLSLKIPQDYPNAPPNIKFLTPVAHVNVNPQGDICTDLFKKGWTAGNDLIKVMLTIQALMSEPDFSDPFDMTLAQIGEKDRASYDAYILSFCQNNCTKL
jgi:ubiquitin-conjugating enzyme E2 D/E